MIFGTKTDKTLLSKVFDIAYHSNFIMWDTAPAYGMGTAERILGDFIPNEHIILSTKYMPSRNYDPKSIERSLEKSISFNRRHGFPAFSRRALAFPKSKLSKLEKLHSKLKEIGYEYNLDITQTAIVWGISKGTIPIIGITKPIQADALKDITNVTLSEKNMYELEKIALLTGIEIAGSWEKQGNKRC